MTMSTRPSSESVYMRFAVILAERATCDRLRVGAIVTDEDMLQVLGIGYNGNAAGLPNACDSADRPGQCGCLHAELNALLKSPGTLPNKVLFCTHAPCVACAKAAINARVSRVFYLHEYRNTEGVKTLMKAGVDVKQLWLDPKHHD